ncbi:MAG: hypothetical protein Tsb002_07150 [Wenzhouxiangellaceae bacterium]
MKIKQFALAALVGLIAGSAAAQDGKTGAAGIISNRAGTVAVESINPVPAGANALCFDTQDIDSWDGLDDADNIIVEFNIGAGNALTGVSWDVSIETVGASWLSEATVQFSNSDGSADPNAINLSVGAGDDMAGTADYSSGGILPFSSVPLADITVNADGILRLQFFESFDDVADTIDGFWNPISTTPAVCAGLSLACTDQAACDVAVGGGTLLPPPAEVPTLSTWTAIALALALMLVGGLVMRRRAAA